MHVGRNIKRLNVVRRRRIQNDIEQIPLSLHSWISFLPDEINREDASWSEISEARRLWRSARKAFLRNQNEKPKGIGIQEWIASRLE